LTPEICNLKLLEELSVSENRLNDLPDNFENLNSLEKLNLADNSIKILPPGLGQIKTLKFLYIHGNRFTAFHTNFANLKRLEEFSLEWFLYAKPPKQKIATSPNVFASLQQLC